MGATIVTTDDLYEFKLELLGQIRELLQQDAGTQVKKWLRSGEVRELLGISPGTLQNLRINGTIPFTKVGGVLYYDYNDIMKMMEKNRVHNKI